MDILASYETQPWTMNVLQCSLENETKTTMAFTAPDMSWHQLSGPHPEHGEGGRHAEAEKNGRARNINLG